MAVIYCGKICAPPQNTGACLIFRQVTDKAEHFHVSDSRWLTPLIYASCLAVLCAAFYDTGLSIKNLGALEWSAAVITSGLSFFLFSVSLFELVSYFVFIPSIRSDAHIFSRVHANQLIHPLTTSFVLASLAVCIFTRSTVAWSLWIVVLAAFAVQTASIVRNIRSEHSDDAMGAPPQNLLTLLAYLILGAEVVTMAAGARAIPPWRIKSLPEDTWIVDVRTRPEFQWNRLHGAQNFPWGVGLPDAAKHVPRNNPILVTCLTGHRSPSVAVMLRRMGFENVYNLNWGLLYLILLERGKSGTGMFDLTRPNRTTSERGRDYKGISYGYIICAFVILIVAPLEHKVMERSVSTMLKTVGAVLGLSGLGLAWLSFKSLGRNFRVFAAPRRSGNLIQSGIYSKVRHPMYTAVISGFAGYVIYWGSFWSLPLWIALTGLYVLKAFKEEEVLKERYPYYGEYQSRTKRFIPFLF